MKRILLHVAGTILIAAGQLLFMNSSLVAQEMPPAPISVSFVMNLNFGAFSQGVGGGSVVIDPTGSRTSSGDIFLVNLGYLYYPAKFELQGNPGTVVHFLGGPPTVLNGSQGGTMTMTLGLTDPATPFILPSSVNGTVSVFLGGVLTVGSPAANPPGVYSGSFNVMFIQE